MVFLPFVVPDNLFWIWFNGNIYVKGLRSMNNLKNIEFIVKLKYE